MTTTLPRVISDPAELRSVLSERGRVGFVPTMGYLHEGHATLISQARAECDLLVVSIFVNPLQFGAGEDLNKYPRDLPRDLGVAGGAGADVLFTPSVDLIYPDGFATRVTVSGVSEGLDGASRPGHFTGVATVVLKLLNLVRPDRVYLGEKDWQQLAVLRRMVRDLNVNVDVIGVPTVRAASGLALSSRNAYLTPEQQARAAVLHKALRAVQDSYAAGETQVQALQQAGLDVLAQESAVELDYLSIVDGKMQPLDSVERQTVGKAERDRNDRAGGDNRNMTRVLLAARMFGVRLIDNLPLNGQAQQEQA